MMTNDEPENPMPQVMELFTDLDLARKYLKGWNDSEVDADNLVLGAVAKLYVDAPWQEEMTDAYSARPKPKRGPGPKPDSDKAFGEWLNQEVGLTWKQPYVSRILSAVDTARRVRGVVNERQARVIKRVLDAHGPEVAAKVMTLAEQSRQSDIAAGQHRADVAIHVSTITRVAKAMNVLPRTPDPEPDPETPEQTIKRLKSEAFELFNQLSAVSTDEAATLVGALAAVVAARKETDARQARAAGEWEDEADDDRDWTDEDADKREAELNASKYLYCVRYPDDGQVHISRGMVTLCGFDYADLLYDTPSDATMCPYCKAKFPTDWQPVPTWMDWNTYVPTMTPDPAPVLWAHGKTGDKEHAFVDDDAPQSLCGTIRGRNPRTFPKGLTRCQRCTRKVDALNGKDA